VGVLLEHAGKSLKLTVEIQVKDRNTRIIIEDVSKTPQDSLTIQVKRILIRIKAANTSSSLNNCNSWKCSLHAEIKPG
jgi:hypothetical protein